MLPWQQLFGHIAPVLGWRQSSYFFIVGRDQRRLLYHPLFPSQLQSNTLVTDFETEGQILSTLDMAKRYLLIAFLRIECIRILLFTYSHTHTHTHTYTHTQPTFIHTAYISSETLSTSYQSPRLQWSSAERSSLHLPLPSRGDNWSTIIWVCGASR